MTSIQKLLKDAKILRDSIGLELDYSSEKTNALGRLMLQRAYVESSDLIKSLTVIEKNSK